MNKKVGCFLCLGVCCLSMQARNLEVKSQEQKIKLTGGAIVEGNISGFIHSGIDGGNSVMKMGVGIGGFLNMGISRSFSIQGEMIFQHKNSGFGLGKQQGDYRYWGMEIPIYAFYRLALPKGGALYAGIGPYTNFGLGASYKSNGRKIDVYEKDKDSGLPAMKDSDTGFGIKVGYEFVSGLQINASYKISVTNVIDANSSKVKMYPHLFSMGVAYRFGK